MEVDPKYTFVPLAPKNYIALNDKAIQEYFCKWGIQGNICVQNFSFNEPFQHYHRYHLANEFFKDEIVAKQLFTKQGDSWSKQGIIASSVETKQIPCSVLSMSFFDKLRDPKNGIVHYSGAIHKRLDEQIDGFLVSDSLRGMLLDEECSEYGLYADDERNEFIFRIFQLFVLGGALCQYEDNIQPYLDVTKAVYKDLVRVCRQNNSTELSVGTLVLEVIAKDYQQRAYFPHDPANRQNVAFLLVDGHSREITMITHQLNGYSHPY